MDKLEVGMYARHKKGICKIDGFASTIYDDYITDEKGSMALIDEILKTSHNIIDLIEEGDYVNGVLVESIYSREENKMLFHTFETEIMMEITNENINNIVTKEQFLNIAYRIGD